MKHLWITIAGLALLGGTLASGILHGRMSNRGAGDRLLRQASARLEKGLPARLGSWRLVKTKELDEEVAKKLQCAGSLQGVYTNDQTGDNISVAIVAGPSGPISVHTPEICFSARDYEMAGERKPLAVLDKSRRKHQLWQLYANARNPSRANLRVIYGWSRGQEWEAASGPRFAYAGVPVLYKIQLATPATDNSQNVDPTQDFLARFLAHIQSNLVTTTRLTSLIE